MPLEISSVDRKSNNVELMSPLVVLDRLRLQNRQFHVVRDDLLPGGSKQRACGPLLEKLSAQGFSEFYYASPFAGFAQVALAYVCLKMGFKCHLYCEFDRTKESRTKHSFTRLAESYGASIVLADSLEAAEDLASDAARKNNQGFKIPLGFNCPEFTEAFKRELQIQWLEVKKQIGQTPKRLWLPVGSGTLISVFKKIVDPETEIKGVNVHVLGNMDERIRLLAEDSDVTLFSAPEKFHEEADIAPSIPSNTHYDAKLWQFLVQYGETGDVWWNVAR